MLRSHEGHRSPGLSKWVGPMASTRSPLERASCGSRSTLAADPSGNLASVYPPFFKQVAWGSESRNRALLHHKTTSYQATTSGTAYTDHGKVTFRADEVRASGAAEKGRHVLTGEDRGGKGLSYYAFLYSALSTAQATEIEARMPVLAADRSQPTARGRVYR